MKYEWLPDHKTPPLMKMDIVKEFLDSNSIKSRFIGISLLIIDGGIIIKPEIGDAIKVLVFDDASLAFGTVRIIHNIKLSDPNSLQQLLEAIK